MEKAPEGWRPEFRSSRAKWHYFVNGHSLCRRWFTFSTLFEQGNDDSPDNCKACAARVKARNAAKEAAQGEK